MPLQTSAKIPSRTCMLYALSIIISATNTWAQFPWKSDRPFILSGKNQTLQQTIIDVNLCVPITAEDLPQTFPINVSGPCYYLETDRKKYILKKKFVTLDFAGFDEGMAEVIDLPPGPLNLTIIEWLKSRITHGKNRIKRSLQSSYPTEDDYDFNHLIPPASGPLLSPSDLDEQQPDFGFRLASPLAQAGQQARPQPQQQYQNDQPPYQVDRRTQILPVPAVALPNDSGSQARPVGETLSGPKIVGPESQVRNQALTKPGAAGSRPPTLRNPLDQIRVHQGKVFRIAVPANTFHDQMDGDTRHLRLELYTIDKRPVASDKKYSWIRFDPVSQQFYGLPALANIGLHEFMLAAINRAGLPVYNAFTIYVQPRPKGFRSADSDPGVNHKFWVVLEDAGAQGGPNEFGSDFRAFKRNVSRQVEFFDALAAYYTSGSNGSSAANYSNFYDTIYLDSITRGSIRVTWLNDSLLSSSQGLPLEILADSVRARGNNYSSYSCPQADIRAIGSRFSADGSGGVNPAFRAAMAPAYSVRNAGYDFLHACGPQPAPVVLPGGRLRSKAAAPARDPIASRDYERDLWMTTIIPSLVMALLLLIASLIACCLYRRRRKPRFMNEDRSIFKKGVPVVIYPDEFEDSSAPPIDTLPNVSYHNQSQPNPTSQNVGSNSTSEDISNGYNGSMRSPVNDPSASYPRPPPYNNPSYQPLLSSQATDFSKVQNQGIYNSDKRPIGPNVYSTLNAG